MKNKFYVLAAFAFVFLCCSCSTTYYYSTISSNDGHVFKTNNGDFVTETDSLYIIYSFFGEDAPINIGVHNKSSQPIFVDWSQSAIIIDNVAKSEKDNLSVSYNGKRYVYKSVTVNGETYNTYEPETKHLIHNVSFIPPQSQIDHTSYRLANFPFDNIPDEAYRTSKFTKFDGTSNVKMVEFSERESPLRFRSYITIYNNDPRNPNSQRTSFEQTFYLSNLMKTKGNVCPEDVLAYQTKSGDFFYVKYYKESGFGQVMGVIALSTAAAVINTLVEPIY